MSARREVAYPSLRFTVPGDPRPQGAVARNPHTHGVFHRDGPRLRAYRSAVALVGSQTARRQRWESPTPFDRIIVDVSFNLRRPRSTAYPGCTRAPDLDKLLRALFDALTESGVIVDDGQITSAQARKGWARPGEEGSVDVYIENQGEPPTRGVR